MTKAEGLGIGRIFSEFCANNLKEVEVVFNQEVEKTSSENKEAYVLIKGIGSVALDAATLQEDGKTVVLTVAGTLTNQATDYKLSVEKIKSADGELTVSEKDIEFKPLDVSFPEVQEVVSLGNKAIKVTFTEPVQMATTVASTFKVDGVVASGLHDVTGRSITINLFSTLADGEHNLTINNNVKDYANYQLVEVTIPFTVVTDSTAPAIAEVKDITLEGATVVFTEDVKKAEAQTASNYFWKQGSSTKAAASAVMLDGKTVRLTFSGANRLPGYTTDLFVKNIVDYSGNKIAADSKIAVSATLDQTRPEVLTYKFDNDAKTMILTFSKAVDQATFKAANVVIKDKDGKVVSNGYTGLVSTGRTLTITLSNKLSAGTYNFDFSGMKDTTLLENSMMPFSTTIETKDTSKPNAIGLTGTGTTYVLTFDKAMDISTSYSILNPANYFVTYVTTDSPARTISGLLPGSTNLSPTNGNKGVIIQLPNGVASITKLSVQGVKDVDGNFLEGYAKEFTTITNSVTITKAEATGKKKVVLTMSQPMSGIINPANFVIDETGLGKTRNVVIATAEVDENDSTKVILKLTTELSADAKFSTNNLEVYTAEPYSNTQGLTGVYLENIANNAGIAIADKIAPSAKTGTTPQVVVKASGASIGLVVPVTTVDQDIKVIFDETIAAVNSALFANNFKVYKADGVQLVYGIDYTAAISAISGNTVTLTLVDTTANLEAYDGTLQVVFDNTNKNIIDASTAKNVAVGFDTDEDTSETDQALIKFTTAPVVSSVDYTLATVGTYANGDKITIKFSENIDASKIGIGDIVYSGTTLDGTLTPGTGNVNELVITLGSATTLASAETLTIGATKVIDTSGNEMASDYVITLP